MRLIQSNEQRLRTLFSWFDDDHSVAVWGGPGMRLPMTFETLKADARLDTLASHFLLDQDDVVVGFGQFYRRIDHVHLGRLVIAPQQRGRGFGTILIEMLSDEGQRSLGLATQSLFVRDDNRRARKLYERTGFTETSYPGNDINRPDIVYMTRYVRP
jgi:ribosomal protein S18 acetylase RimI-like enzyme